ncbi:MAG: GNAT family N-acetyltransferase [Pseudomonadota bacterium]
MTSGNILTTERTLVDRITLNDAPFFFELMNSPGWLRYIGDRGIADIDAAHRVIRDAYLKVYEEHGFGYYVIKASIDLRPIGICGFLKKPHLSNPDFGFAMLPDYHGQGLAREACTAILQFGVRSFDFSILDAVTKPSNLRSIRLLEQLNFCPHGLIEPENGEEALALYRWDG